MSIANRMAPAKKMDGETMQEQEQEQENYLNSPSTPPSPKLTREPADAWMERLHDVTRSIESIPYTPPEVVADCARWLLMFAEHLLSVRPVEPVGARVGPVDSVGVVEPVDEAADRELAKLAWSLAAVQVERGALRDALGKVRALCNEAAPYVLDSTDVTDDSKRGLALAVLQVLHRGVLLAAAGVPEPKPQTLEEAELALDAATENYRQALDRQEQQ